MKNTSKREICVTIDLEDYRRTKKTGQKPYRETTSIILQWLKEKKIRATFFVVGQLAEESPELIEKISLNHDIAFHSFDHALLTDESIDTFVVKTEKSKKFIEDITGKKIIGFRAPCFSLIPQTLWVTKILSELGFEYSSSTIPTKLPKFGFPGIPETPFKWESGLIEFPMVLSNFYGKRIPSIGGAYLRFFPIWFTLKTLNKEGLRWTYLHPQDIYMRNGFNIVKGLNFFQSIAYHYNRKKTLVNLEALLQCHEVVSLECYLQNIKKALLPKFK